MLAQLVEQQAVDGQPTSRAPGGGRDPVTLSVDKREALLPVGVPDAPLGGDLGRTLG